MLSNLISNAIKFSDPGSRILIGAKRTDSFVEFRVADNGRGIPHDAVEMVFDRFMQVDSSDQREKGGTGLGLAICSAIVQQHGGQIWVESALGEGSTFYFTLPRSELASVQDTPPVPSVSPSVLVCEDDPEFTELLRALLEGAGYYFIPTPSAGAAMAYIEKNSVAAVVLDIHLPGMSGLEMLNAIQDLPEAQRPPVIVVSRDKRSEHTDLPPLALLDWITKPIDEARLLARLKAALKVGKPGSALLVDDDPDFCAVIAQLLERKNIIVETAGNGVAAVKIYRKSVPDIIILDLVMPDGDGFYVIDELRGDLESRRTPIVIYSAKEPTSEEKKRIATDTTIFLTKLKIPQDEFVGHVVELLGDGR